MLNIDHLITFFFFNDTATTEIYTLSLHDALPICSSTNCARLPMRRCRLLEPCEIEAGCSNTPAATRTTKARRSEEHTSELQSQFHLVCRLLLEKKKKNLQYSQYQINPTHYSAFDE